MSWKIYHNPKCSKSRQTLALLQENGIKPQIIEYLKDAPNKKQLLEILSYLDEEPKALVRTKEDDYKAAKFDLTSAETVATQLAKNPKLIERPIVIHGKNAVLGRPPENIKKLMP